MNVIKVLFVVIQLDAGGSERIVVDLAKNLDKSHFEVFVATFKGGVLREEFERNCKKVFFIDKRHGFDLSAMWNIKEIISNNKIDVVNAHHYKSCFYSFLGCCIFNKKRLIYTEHSVPEVLNILKGKHKYVLRYMLSTLDGIIGVSCEIKECFKKNFPKHSSKINVVFNGVDIDKFKKPKFKYDVRHKFGFQKEHYVVGMIANFRKVKNHACLIKAFARLMLEHPNLRILLVGTSYDNDIDNTENEIRKMVHLNKMEEKVVFAGYQSDIPLILSEIDCFCLPSFSEGLPVCILEAMAAELIIVGSDVSGIREVISNGVTGYLFGTDDDSHLAITLDGIIKGEKTIDKKILKSEVFKYSKDKWIIEMQKIFKEI